MFKKFYLYNLLTIFFISHQIHCAETKLDYSPEEAAASSTSATASTTSTTQAGDAAEITIDTILREISAIEDENQCLVMLNMLYLKKELLHAFIAAKLTKTDEESRKKIGTIFDQIVDRIEALEKMLTPNNRNLIDSIEELVKQNSSALCINDILNVHNLFEMYSQQHKQCLHQLQEIIRAVDSTHMNIQASLNRSVQSLASFFDRGRPGRIEIGKNQIILSENPHEQRDAWQKYFDFFERLDAEPLNNPEIAKDSDGQLLSDPAVFKNLYDITTTTQKHMKLFSKLMSLAIKGHVQLDENPIKLFGKTKRLEKTYNTIYDALYLRKTNPKISYGPNFGEFLPSTLFEKFETEEELRIKILRITTLLDVSKIFFQAKQRSKKQQWLRETIKMAHLQPLAFESVVKGYISELIFRINEESMARCNEIAELKNDSIFLKYKQQEYAPATYVAHPCLFGYLGFLKEKYSKNLESQPVDKQEKKSKPRSVKQKFAGKKHRPEKQKKKTKIRHEKEQKQEATPETKTTKITPPTPAPAMIEATTEDSTKEPSFIASFSAEIEQVLYEEEIIKDTPMFTVLVKNWGPSSKEGYTLILYKESNNLVDLKGYTFSPQVKFDKFHTIPNIINLHFGVPIFSEKVDALNSYVRPSQRIELGPNLFAICVKALMLSKYSHWWIENKTDAEVREMQNWPAGPGFFKGAFVFIFDKEKRQCFHQCFHEFVVPTNFDQVFAFYDALLNNQNILFLSPWKFCFNNIQSKNNYHKKYASDNTKMAPN